MIEADSVHSTPRANSPIERHADSAGELYRRTDISPEQFFQALGRLRSEAEDEIERLLAFLDRTEPDPDLEPEESGIGDLDGLLEQVGTQSWQPGAMA
ncbi:hypothetical protein [Bradyrhizobium sp. SSUT77]|uniref:hypothetical protein n=1 Tax=Bradyrhizobium sp. SSUT77 TaxID=3040603 RepID=UPI00244BF5DB|nr:hypothetical protein [Bradyrhizobium sp. SSUT77]MDH2343239.1 hypothetical protein [Bradyrhizobium sp. SSUT77]